MQWSKTRQWCKCKEGYNVGQKLLRILFGKRKRLNIATKPTSRDESNEVCIKLVTADRRAIEKEAERFCIYCIPVAIRQPTKLHYRLTPRHRLSSVAVTERGNQQLHSFVTFWARCQQRTSTSIYLHIALSHSASNMRSVHRVLPKKLRPKPEMLRSGSRRTLPSELQTVPDHTLRSSSH